MDGRDGTVAGRDKKETRTDDAQRQLNTATSRGVGNKKPSERAGRGKGKRRGEKKAKKELNAPIRVDNQCILNRENNGVMVDALTKVS